jgi:hypothetical protein
VGCCAEDDLVVRDPAGAILGVMIAAEFYGAAIIYQG